jgi:hypothetical protein
MEFNFSTFLVNCSNTRSSSICAHWRDRRADAQAHMFQWHMVFISCLTVHNCANKRESLTAARHVRIVPISVLGAHDVLINASVDEPETIAALIVDNSRVVI